MPFLLLVQFLDWLIFSDVIFNDLLDAHQSGNNDGMNINLSHGISIGKYNSYLSQDEEQGISLDASLLLTQSDYH